MRSCKKYLLLLGLLLMAAVGGCGGIGYEETDENLSLIHISEPTRRS